MKTFFLISFCFLTGLFVGGYLSKEFLKAKKDKQHLKLIRKGCCQFRINEYTNEVKHFEGCDNLGHFNN